MSLPFVGEIRLFAGNFAPAGWAFCNGALLPISENDTLFTLIGTSYDGDGQSTFALPDLRGRVPVHQGNGSVIGELAGVESVTLTVAQTPNHSHSLIGSGAAASQVNVAGGLLAATTGNLYFPPGGGLTAPLNSASVAPTGGSQPHSNMQPYLGLNFIISLFGIFPSPN